MALSLSLSLSPLSEGDGNGKASIHTFCVCTWRMQPYYVHDTAHLFSGTLFVYMQHRIMGGRPEEEGGFIKRETINCFCGRSCRSPYASETFFPPTAFAFFWREEEKRLNAARSVCCFRRLLWNIVLLSNLLCSVRSGLGNSHITKAPLP